MGKTRKNSERDLAIKQVVPCIEVGIVVSEAQLVTDMEELETVLRKSKLLLHVDLIQDIKLSLCHCEAAV